MTEVLESNENHFLIKENEELKRDIKSLQRRIRLLRSFLKMVPQRVVAFGDPGVLFLREAAKDALKADSKLSRLAIEVKKMMRRPIGGVGRREAKQSHANE